MNRNGKMVFRVLALFLALLLVIGTIVMPIVFADTDDEAAGDEEYEANYDEEYYGRFRGEVFFGGLIWMNFPSLLMC